MAEMSTLNGYEIVDEGSRTLLNDMGEPVTASEKPLPMNGFMNGKYEIVDRKARDKINEILANMVQDGYTVNFFDSNNQLIQTTRTKYGYKADLPLSYVVDHWEDINGTLKQFPLTISADSGVQTLNVYESDEAMTCERVLYGHFGVKKEDYPCVIVEMDNVYGSSTIMFFTMTWFNVDGGKLVLMNPNWSTTRLADLGVIDWTDNVTETIDKIIAKNYTLSGPRQSNDFNFHFSPTTQYRLYTNFANDHSSARLDQMIYGSGMVLPPYSLQEKTAEQGDTVEPDEGYYGLSKVTVTPAPLQEKMTFRSGEITADSEYYGLSKVIVDVPAGGNIDSGYSVNFYNHDKVLIETRGAKCGNSVIPPYSYEADAWEDESGFTYSFPFTVPLADTGKVYNMFAAGLKTVEQELYSFYGVDKQEYPHLLLFVNGQGNAGSSDFSLIAFAKSYGIRKAGSTNYLQVAGLYKTTGYYALTSNTLNDFVKYVKTNITSLTDGTSDLKIGNYSWTVIGFSNSDSMISFFDTFVNTSVDYDPTYTGRITSLDGIKFTP